MRLLQGAIFYTKGQTCNDFWDVEADKKFEVSIFFIMYEIADSFEKYVFFSVQVKQPEAKKQRKGEDE